MNISKAVSALLSGTPARTLLEDALPATLSGDEMTDFILDYGLQDAFGEIDYDSARHIARSADEWVLKTIPIGWVSWSIPPRRRKRKQDIPPIVLWCGEEYEVLDGKHRLGEARHRGEASALCYVGQFFGLTE